MDLTNLTAPAGTVGRFLLCACDKPLPIAVVGGPDPKANENQR
jgi:hypothetical protein